MLLCLEGPDKSGKTTIVNELKKLYPSAAFLKQVHPNSMLEVKQQCSLLFTTLNSNNLTILDRFFYISGPIYDTVNTESVTVSKDSEYWPYYYEKVLPEFKKHNIKFIYLYAPMRILKQRFKAVNETDIQLQWYSALLQGYTKWATSSSLNIFTINTHTYNMQETLNFIKEII